MIQSFSPRVGQAFGPVFAEATDRQVDAVVSRAAELRPYLASMSDSELSRLLSVMAAGLSASRLELAEIADRETALGVERLSSEIGRTANQLDAFADFVASGQVTEPLVHPRVRDKPDLRRTSVPLGVVAVFSASNFPFAFSVAGGDTASALAARCPVVVKAHPGHPQTSAQVLSVLRRSLADAGFTQDVVQLIHGRTDVSRLLVEHPLTAAVGFTGSARGGSALTRMAFQRPVPIPVYAEQGSLNPVVLGESSLTADFESVVTVIGASIVNGFGQFCTKPGVIFVPTTYRSSVADSISEAFAATLPVHLLTAEISQRFDDQLRSIESLPDVHVWRGEAATQGFTVAPATIECSLPQFLKDDELTEEVFGPATVVCGVEAPSDLTAAAEAIGGSLTATVWGEIDDPWVECFLRVFPSHAGRVIYQGIPTGVAVDAAMQHGGPFPSSNNSQFTAVGLSAVRRFQRPITFQSFPERHLPAELRRMDLVLAATDRSNA